MPRGDGAAGARERTSDPADLAGTDLAADLAPRLLAWYDRSARDLAWRRRSDPYAIWVAEVMLQQTRVVAVERHYERWLARFPDVAALARASLEEVLAAWRGLGYYGRARNLHGAAVLLARERHCRLPRTYDGWLELPGVGPYTAGAVASIAFGERVPAIDGNVRRVLARVSGDAGEAASARGGRRSAALARALVERPRPGDVNQALMDLGATVCLPRLPACGACPLGAGCRAALEGRTTELPGPSPAPLRRDARRVALVALGPQDTLLLARRAEGGWLAGLWEAPQAVIDPPAPERAALRAARDLADALGLARGPLAPRQPVRHDFTHIAWLVTPVRLEVTDRCPADGEPFAPPPPAGAGDSLPNPADGLAGAGYDGWMWARPARIRAMAMSRLAEKVLASAGVPASPSAADPDAPEP